MVKTKRVSNGETKQVENKQNKGKNKTKQTGSRLRCFHSMFKGEKEGFSSAKNVNRIEDAFLENFSANRRSSPCLSSYKSEIPLFQTIPQNSNFQQ